MDSVEEVYSKLWSVVTSDRDKALKVISEIEHRYGVVVNYKKVNRNEISVFFEDGVWLRWVRASDNARGYRHGKLWCDSNIPKEILDCVILPKYFGEYSEIIWI